MRPTMKVVVVLMRTPCTDGKPEIKSVRKLKGNHKFFHKTRLVSYFLIAKEKTNKPTDMAALITRTINTG